MTLPLPPARLDVEANVADYGVGLAYAAHLGDEGRALSLLQIEAASWARAQRWPLRIADAVERGDRALVATFGAAFNETKARLAAATAEASAATGSAAREEVELGPGLLAQLSNEAVVNPPPPLARSERPAPVAPAAEPEPAPESAPPATAPAGEV
ncbi:MAG TPA: hypothetical protein VHB21_21980, partial [Minicystis sp.]|nr:hypothetical protein [Minicystis sp.]